MDIRLFPLPSLPTLSRLLAGLMLLMLIIIGLIALHGYISQDSGEFGNTTTSRDLYAVGDENFPPFSFLLDGETVGYDVDVMRSVAVDLNRTVHIELMQWSDATDLVARGERDILIGVAITDERKSIYDFTERTLNQRTARFMRRDDFTLPTQDLSHWDGIVAGQRGDLSTIELQGKYPNLTIVEYPDQVQALEAVINEQADLFVGNYYVGMYTLQKLGATTVLKTVGDPESERPYGMAVQRGNTALLSELNQAIDRLKQSGEMKKIRDRWFGEDFFTETIMPYLMGILILSGGAVLVITLYSLVLRRYNTRLNEKVREQTDELMEKNRRLQDSENELRLHIAELDANRRALSASEERFSLAMQATRDGIWDWQLDSEDLYFSPGYYHMLGYEADEIPFNYKVYLDHIHPDYKDLAESVFSRIMSGNQSFFEMEHLMRRKEGGYIWILSRGMTMSRDDSGRPVRIVGTHVNITTRKKTESELAELKILLDAAFKQSNVAMILIRLPDKGMYLINTMALEIFGIDPEVVLTGMSFSDISSRSMMNPETGEQITVENHPLMKAARGVRTTGYEAGVIDNTGSLRHLLINASPIFSQQGRCIAAIMVCTDISERRRVEEAMNLVNRKLNLLTSITRNEIQNQVFVLLGYLEICRSETTEPEVDGLLRRMHETVNLLSSHISLTRNYQDMGVVPPKWQNIREVYVYAASHVNLSEITHIQNTKSYEVFADLFLEKALTNVLTNAINLGGSVSRISSWTEERDGDLLLIITDDGAGIEPETKEIIFQQGKISDQGFGLFFAKEVLSITGLSITETGEAGRGGRFEILFPKGKYRRVREGDGEGGN